MRGVARIRISHDLMKDWFEKGVEAAEPLDPLKEVEVLRVNTPNEFRGYVELVISSPDLPEVPMGHEIPVLNMLWRQKLCPKCGWHR